MTLLQLFVVLIVLGVLLWVVTTYLPMDARIKNIIVVVGVIVAIFLVLQFFGILNVLGGVRVR